jgi:hypothetical protein
MNNLTNEIEAALRGLDYPATRSKLLTVAFENGASRDVVDRILDFPETADFLNEHALEQALGVRVPGAHPHGWE